MHCSFNYLYIHFCTENTHTCEHMEDSHSVSWEYVCTNLSFECCEYCELTNIQSIHIMHHTHIQLNSIPCICFLVCLHNKNRIEHINLCTFYHTIVFLYEVAHKQKPNSRLILRDSIPLRQLHVFHCFFFRYYFKSICENFESAQQAFMLLM